MAIIALFGFLTGYWGGGGGGGGESNYFNEGKEKRCPLSSFRIVFATMLGRKEIVIPKTIY